MSTSETNELSEPKAGSKKNVAGVIVVNLVLIAAVVLSVLWLPPISLTKRLIEGKYTTLGAGIWSVADADGTQFTVLPEGLNGTVMVQINSVPRSDFLDGTADQDLLPAAESIPSFLDVKSPLYRVNLRGKTPASALLTVPIPNDATPYETLDVYGWIDEQWQWLPSEVIAAEDVILVELNRVPEKMDFAVAQTRPLPPVVSAYMSQGAVPETAAGVLVELSARQLNLGDNGTVLGDVQASGSVDTAVVPVLTNVNTDGTIRNDLADNLLIDPTLQQTHIGHIVTLVNDQGYQGIELDYRAINPGLREALNGFVSNLADALHKEGKILLLRVETPRQVSFEEWDTGVYDWARLGQVVDGIKVPGMSDPQAYVADGQMEQLIRWAVTQIPRQKVQIVLFARSVDMMGSNPTYMPYTEAMAPFTTVATLDQRQVFKAEERVVLNLSAGEGSTSIMYDEGAHAYWFRYRDDRRQEHTVWLENAASIAWKLRLLAEYNLRGAAFDYLLDDGNDTQVWQVVREYHTLTIPEMRDQFAVIWTVTDSSGKQVENVTAPLNNSQLVWVAPEKAGEYTVVAALSSDNGQTATVQGQAMVEVGQVLPTPTPTPTQAPETQPEATATPTEEATATPTPTPTQGAEVAWTGTDPKAVVTNAQLNLRAGPGTEYARTGQVRQGDTLKIVGRNEQGTWLQVVTSGGTEAWVILTYVQTDADINSLPVIEAPALPTPAAGATATPSSPSSPVGPTTPTRSTSFGYGVQAHEDTARVCQAINDIGFGWLKQQVRWENHENPKGQYSFGGLDNLVNTANGAGVKVLFSVVAAPSWARGGKSGVGPPDNYQDFYDFMGATAAHFKGRVSAYEIWNEQNLSREWEGAPLSASDYVRLLKGAYQAIKAADPNAIVVSGAPTPTGISDGVWAIDDRAYLQQMYNAGLKYYCDAIGAHPSGYANPPDVYYTGGNFDPNRGYDDHPSFFFRNTMEDYYKIMANNGDGAKRIWATEFGWPSTSGMGVSANAGYEFANDLNEQQQADYIVRAYTWSRNWGHAGVMFLWNLNFWPAAGAQNEMAKYGIVRGDWSPRPAYTALKNMPK